MGRSRRAGRGGARRLEGDVEAAGEDVFDAGYSTNAEGVGFGLSIVTEIVDAHGWDIVATEAANGGARFEVSGVAEQE